MFFLDRFLQKFIVTGRLSVIDVDGELYEYGPDDDIDATPVTVALTRRALSWKLAFNPYLYFGEAYMDGTLQIRRGTLWDLLDLCGRNLALRGPTRHGRLTHLAMRLLHRARQANSRIRARRNVAHHYDFSVDLYRAFLDSDLQYSCAYFRTPHTDLNAAQLAKKRHIAAKLLIHRNHRVLDIGCGFGGLAIELAKHYNVRVDGVTLSREQLAMATSRATEAGLAENVRFSLTDYRDTIGPYDRIVSVGMFEHVGTPHYAEFFSKVRGLLAPGGVALIHTIGSLTEPRAGNSWIQKYIFPGGYVPSLSEAVPAIEASGLIVTDVEVLRLHYAETLRHWRERFHENWPRITHLYDERFHRMWEFYLAACEMEFRYDGLAVFQIQISNTLEAVPLTRDYIKDAEEGLMAQMRKDESKGDPALERA
jgi:cyclopropane-fatty-acyl-phospholipid synthase